MQQGKDKEEAEMIETTQREKESFFQEMMRDLYRESLKDGIITAEEKALLQQIETGLKEYSSAIDAALEDHILTNKEADQLRRIQTSILKNVADTAGADSIITADEKALIKKLAKYLLYQLSTINRAVK